MREAARLASTASPSAPPIMNDVLTTPEARPGLFRRDVAHRGQQHGVEGHPGADAEEDHARQDVGEHVSVDGCAREERKPDRREPEPRHERRPDAKRRTSFAESTIENAPMIRLAGRNVRPTSAGCSRARAGGTGQT